MSNLSKKELRLIKKYPHLFNVTYTDPEYRLFNGMLFSSGKNIETITWGVISGNPLSNQALAQLFAQYTTLDYTNQVIAQITTEVNNIWREFTTKQDILTAGTGITIENNVISCTASGDVTKEYVDTQDRALQTQIDAKPSTTYVDSKVSAEADIRSERDNALLANINDLSDRLNTTNSKIPESASTSNMLITQSEMDTAIAQSAARYITADASGNPFGTRALLISGPWFYNGESITTFQRTDYAIVSKDETHDNAQCRYMYTNTWSFQYVISTTLTEEQLAALNSTITKEKVTKYNGYEETINSKASTTELEAEATARTTDIASVNRAIENETTSRINADEQLANAIPTKTSQLTNDSGFLTEHQSLAEYAKTTYVDTQVNSEASRATSEEGRLEGLIDSLDSTKVSISGDTMRGNLSIEKISPEVIFNGTGETNYGGLTWKQQGTTKYQCRYNNSLDKVYFQDSDNNPMVVPKGTGTLATVSQVNEKSVVTASTEESTGADTAKSITIDGTSYNLPSGSSGTTMVETTYSELKTLRNNSQLIAGCWYRITDYVATTTQENTQTTSNQYDIIVLATSTNTLSEEARAIQHTGDTYFANSNLNKWKVWYSLDNDSTRYAWADTTNGKGVVYHLIDEFDNDIWYDFKLIQVKNSNKSDRFYYLFDNEGVDISLNRSSTIICYSNHFGNYIMGYKYYIGCNICYSGNEFFNNTIGNNFSNNTIGNNFSNNTIRNEFFNNTIGNEFFKNTIGNYFRTNTIGNYFRNNTIGNNFFNNTIGNEFSDNTIGNYFHLNTIGNSFRTNTIGNEFFNNNLSAITTLLYSCTFSSGIDNRITTSTTSLASKRTYYLGSDGSFKSLD